MSEIIKSFGNNAGKVWDILNDDGPQVQTKLQKKAKLREEEFYSAIGWLARENKIYKDKRTFKLGNTNLTSEIGVNAGKIWEILTSSTEIDVNAISRLTKIHIF